MIWSLKSSQNTRTCFQIIYQSLIQKMENQEKGELRIEKFGFQRGYGFG